MGIRHFPPAFRLLALGAGISLVFGASALAQNAKKRQPRIALPKVKPQKALAAHPTKVEPPPITLEVYRSRADVILFGRVLSVRNMHFLPRNSRGPLQSTTFLVLVERSFKGNLKPGEVIPYFCLGGSLPYRTPDTTYQGFYTVGDPVPVVGERYIMALSRRGFQAPRNAEGKVEAVVGDTGRGIEREGDEYLDAFGGRSKVHLKNGRTYPAPARWEAATNWQFTSGPQLVGVTEQEAAGRLSQ